MKTTNLTEINGLTIPTEVLETMNMGDSITLTASENVVVLKSSKMTALEVINVIEGLECIITDLYGALIKVCGKCADCEDCTYCDGIDEDNIAVPDWAMEEAGLELGTKLCIYVDEDSGIITIEPVGHDFDISDVSEDMMEILSDAGLCLGELNDSIIMEEIIYEG